VRDAAYVALGVAFIATAALTLRTAGGWIADRPELILGVLLTAGAVAALIELA
jgi:hypothetical protein